MDSSKSDLRKIFRAKIAENKVTGHLSALEQRLETLLQNDQGRWAAYCPLADEPMLRFNNLKSEVSWVFPRVEGENIQFYEADQSELIPNRWKILEPDPSKHRLIDISSLSGIIVPGIAFDLAGYRLGRGLGYYDRALNSFMGKKIGVAFSWQVTETLPREPFDIPMDIIVTEKSIIRANAGDLGK